MRKNGQYFVSVIETADFMPATWDPYAYRRTAGASVFADFATAKKVETKQVAPERLPFAPIEYRDIPGGPYLSFMLRPSHGAKARRLPMAAEGELLVGTMRAYLGNIIVTPLAEWVGQDGPVHFAVKSEFISVSPHDGLSYFWLAYMRSASFLSHLPPGHGGTRPRLRPEGLSRTLVGVPGLEVRRAVNDELQRLAREEWEIYCRSASLCSSALEERGDPLLNFGPNVREKVRPLTSRHRRLA